MPSSRPSVTSTVVISAREEADFGVLLKDEDWQDIELDPAQRVWTDDYSNVLGAIIRQIRKDNEPDADEPAATEPVPTPAPAPPVPTPPTAVPAPAPAPETPAKEPEKQ